jgi:hypothetical protein
VKALTRLLRPPRGPVRRRPTLEALEDRLVLSPSAIASNFNGTPIAAGDTVWFSSVAKVSGVGSAPATLFVTGATIDFTANGTPYNLSVPNATITISPTATAATTTFDAATQTWETTVPANLGGNLFLAGFALPVPAGLPGGINPVTWHANFSSDTAGLSVNWQWAAAVYSQFGTDYNALNVKPVDSNQASAYKNSDHAGTPEAFRQYVLGGARGGGGSNFTGSYSGTAGVQPSLLPPPGSLSGYVTDVTTGVGLSGVAMTLTGITTQGQQVTLTTTTNANGFYSFTGLLPGTYTITQTPPLLYQDFSNAAGSLGGTASVSQDDIFNIVVAAGANGTQYNFEDVTAIQQ